MEKLMNITCLYCGKTTLIDWAERLGICKWCKYPYIFLPDTRGFVDLVKLSQIYQTTSYYQNNYYASNYYASIKQKSAEEREKDKLEISFSEQDISKLVKLSNTISQMFYTADSEYNIDFAYYLCKAMNGLKKSQMLLWIENIKKQGEKIFSPTVLEGFKKAGWSDEAVEKLYGRKRMNPFQEIWELLEDKMQAAE